MVETQWVRHFELAIRHAKYLELPKSELKWSKVSATKLFAYKLVVDQFFDFSLPSSPIHFHSIVVDTSKRREDIYNDGDKEIGFSKEVYQLLMKCSKLYPDGCFDAYPDHRETNVSNDDLLTILNNGCSKRGDRRPSPFRRVQFRDSKEVISLQIADILLGAMTFTVNGHHLKPDASAAKKDLSAYVLDRANVRDPSKDTSYRGKYTIWHRQLKEGMVPQGQGKKRHR